MILFVLLCVRVTDKTVYSVVTVGCPTAYSLKFKAGGLAKLQNTSALVSLGGAGDTKSARAKNVASEHKISC